jgi:AraC family transcriptional regulator
MPEQTQPRIVSRGAFLVAGLRYEGRNEHGEITALWERDLLPRLGELAPLRPNRDCYGLERWPVPPLPEGAFEYIAGVEVTSLDSLPPGMVGVTVPARTYAVEVAQGPSDIARVWSHVLGEWLVQAEGYVRAGGYCFEHYPPTFAKDSRLFIYFAIERA